MTCADTPAAWRVAARGLGLVRASLAGRLLVIAAIIVYAVARDDTGTCSRVLQVAIAAGYVAAVVASAAGAWWVAWCGPRGYRPAIVGAAALTTEATITSLAIIGTIRATPDIVYVAAIAFIGGVIAVVFAARALADGASRPDHARWAGQVGGHMIFAVVLAVAAFLLVPVNEAMTCTIAMIDVVYACVLYLAATLMLGAVRDALHAYAPGPPLAIARVRRGG
jgi:hypothetical protein